MSHLVFVHASDGNNAELARRVEHHATSLGHEVTHVSLNACDFPVYTVQREKDTEQLPGLDTLKKQRKPETLGSYLLPSTTAPIRQR